MLSFKPAERRCRRGSDGFDLREVARKAGVSHGAPYRHFADKQALIAAIVETGFRELADGLEKSLTQAVKDTSEKLGIVAVAYVRFAVRNQWLMREMFSARNGGEQNMEIHAAEKAVYRIYSGVIRAGQEAGEIGQGDPNALAGVFWALMHGMATLIIDNQVSPYAEGDEGITRFVLSGVNTIFQGMRLYPLMETRRQVIEGGLDAT